MNGNKPYLYWLFNNDFVIVIQLDYFLDIINCWRSMKRFVPICIYCKVLQTLHCPTVIMEGGAHVVISWMGSNLELC